MRFFLLLSSFFIVSLSALLTSEIYLPHTSFNGEKQVQIMPGMGLRQIVALLENGGLIRSRSLFMLYVSLRGTASTLLPGIYTFRDDTSFSEIARTLEKGGISERAITIREGWTIGDIADELNRQSLLDAEGFENFTDASGARTFHKAFPFLAENPEGATLEGYLFPDTYRIAIGSDARTVVTKFLENFEKKLSPELTAEIRVQGKRLFDIVTTASLIEKEVVSDEDRALVSGILWKRLAVGIPLQVDATITYIMNRGSRIADRISSIRDRGRISIEDTKIDSPYNTYLYRGLPRGPIASPGLSAIRAAIFPKQSPYFYYLSASDGRTIFSRTLEEHNIAKARYLKK